MLDVMHGEEEIMEAIVYTATFIIYDLVLFCPTAVLGSRQQQTVSAISRHMT